MEPVTIDITDTLDLHTFIPKEIPDLINNYLSACTEKGIYSVRIIHGKGAGILKARVRSILARHPQVNYFNDAPPEAGGWGATLVKLTLDEGNPATLTKGIEAGV
jgi:DNA-nicking Smr family endonuclease